MARLPKEEKEKVIKYIKLQHRQTGTWLQEHIKSKFGYDIPASTIRYYKCTNACNTNRKACREDWLNFIRKHYRHYTDKQMAKLLKDKFQRNITAQHVKKLRLEHNLWRPHSKGRYTVREVRKCINCGKAIKITCQNPDQKYCCLDCFHAYVRKTTWKRNLSVMTTDKFTAFHNTWDKFVKRIMYDAKGSLSTLDLEEVYTDYIRNIPSLIYWIETHKLRHAHQRSYIAKAVRNIVNAKLYKRIAIDENEVSIEDVSIRFKNIYGIMK